MLGEDNGADDASAAGRNATISCNHRSLLPVVENCFFTKSLEHDISTVERLLELYTFNCARLIWNEK